ncbi:hypothetical protein JRO89_XS10G0049800 [Xanthoceras sorbifolium]|uniref:GTPase Der n=1 Tax=Xanthoceras sorbifolium TaxID=99658 RepID=A0ABQ8HHR3_9ROSI|nr:hypothetical protein JRO89_XS10G0049800 [Xanthoceras sorbifolium]
MGEKDGDNVRKMMMEVGEDGFSGEDDLSIDKGVEMAMLVVAGKLLEKPIFSSSSVFGVFAIVGRPNVGPDGQKFRLIDTAGIRRRAAITSSGSTTEALSVNRAFRAIRHSDVVALVIEALACITEQDFRIAERIEKEGKGCLIVVNKWDTIPNKNQQTATYYEQDVREKLDWAPIVYSTAIAGHSVDNIYIDKIGSLSLLAVEKERSRRLSTAILNQVVQEALAFKSPPRTRGGKRGRIYYCTQAAIRPPTFVFFVNDAKLFPETYRRYMEKQLRTDAGFSGTPIRLLWQSRRKMEKNEGQYKLLQFNCVLKHFIYHGFVSSRMHLLV